LLQGTAMGLLFVPLTTVTNDPIPNEQMGNATSIFNLMRNIGASFGIAAVTTIIARHSQTHINILGGHITPYSQGTRQALQGAQGMFGSGGSPPTQAGQQGLGAIWGMVQQQAAMLSFIDAFRLLGIIFLFMLPLIFLMKRPKKRGGATMAH
jgi:DHA2 family multidrug resistance protein